MVGVLKSDHNLRSWEMMISPELVDLYVLGSLA
jgi:hypothetical protein